jgi:hypothetical protein
MEYNQLKTQNNMDYIKADPFDFDFLNNKKVFPGTFFEKYKDTESNNIKYVDPKIVKKFDGELKSGILLHIISYNKDITQTYVCKVFYIFVNLEKDKELKKLIENRIIKFLFEDFLKKIPQNNELNLAIAKKISSIKISNFTPFLKEKFNKKYGKSSFSSNKIEEFLHFTIIFLKIDSLSISDFTPRIITLHLKTSPTEKETQLLEELKRNAFELNEFEDFSEEQNDKELRTPKNNFNIFWNFATEFYKRLKEEKKEKEIFEEILKTLPHRQFMQITNQKIAKCIGKNLFEINKQKAFEIQNSIAAFHPPTTAAFSNNELSYFRNYQQ